MKTTDVHRILNLSSLEFGLSDGDFLYAVYLVSRLRLPAFLSSYHGRQVDKLVDAQISGSTHPRYGLNPALASASVTAVPAKAAGMDHGVGTIAEGLLFSYYYYYYLSSPRAHIRDDTGYDTGTYRSTTSSR